MSVADCQCFDPAACSDCPSGFVCYCLKVTEETVLSAIHSGAATTFAELRAITGAGEGCTACHFKLRAHLERHGLDGGRVGGRRALVTV